MSDLASWLLAQITEDERNVTVAAWVSPLNSMVLPVTEYGRESVGFERSRFVAECEAKRRVVELHHSVPYTNAEFGIVDAQVCWVCHSRMDSPVDDDGEDLDDDWQYPLVQDRAPCKTLRLLALPYADRPGYLQEWQP